MKKLVMTAVLAAALLAVPVLARAHEGHAHKVMGTVTSIEGNHVMVKTTEGKTVMVMLDAKTKITRGKTAVKPEALKVGERIVAAGAEQKDMLTAATIQLGAQLPAKPAAKATDTHGDTAAH